jgi:triacylglycerol lipase
MSGPAERPRISGAGPATIATVGEAESEAQVAATLSALAYLGAGQTPERQLELISGLLAEDRLPTRKAWQVVWGPAELGGDLAFIAAGPDQAQAVVIRGTIVENLFDLVQDSEVGTQVALPFPAPDFPAARISLGASLAWRNLSSMTAGVGSSIGSTMLQFLKQLPAGSRLLVTGHSLGGQMASVVAAWLDSALQAGSTALVPITFAAPTAGDDQFATHFDAIFGEATRYYSDLDVVPLLWTRAGLDQIREMYAGGPRCEAGCLLAVDAARERIGDLVYQQPSKAARLESRLYGTSGAGQFEQEVLDQHRPLLYMFLLGIPPAAIQLIDPSWQPPSGAAAENDG